MQNISYKKIIQINLGVSGMNNRINLNIIEDSELKHDFYMGEEDFISEMSGRIEPYLESVMTAGTFQSFDKSVIAYRNYMNENSDGCIVISHGFSEFGEKYNEMVYYFLKGGYSVFLMEHRGHGNSARFIDNPSKVHVKSYIEYAKDMRFFMQKIVLPQTQGKPHYLFGHSMGGCIAAMYLEKYPGMFDKAIFSSPMLQVNFGKCPSPVARPLVRYYSVTGRGGEYVFGGHDFDGVYSFTDSSSKSEARYEYTFKKRMDNIEYQTYGATFLWVKAGTEAAQKVRKRKNVRRIKIPVLIFQAGADTLVKPRGQEKFASYCKNAELVHVAKAKHEIFNELTPVRNSYYEKIFSFLEN